MEKTRAGHNTCLNRWSAHLAELTDTALKYIDDPVIKDAFRDWVVKGEHAPQYGDNLYDLLLCKRNPHFKMTSMFFYVTVEVSSKSIFYRTCTLRRQMGNLPPMTKLEGIYLFPETLEIQLGDDATVAPRVKFVTI